MRKKFALLALLIIMICVRELNLALQNVPQAAAFEILIESNIHGRGRWARNGKYDTTEGAIFRGILILMNASYS